MYSSNRSSRFSGFTTSMKTAFSVIMAASTCSGAGAMPIACSDNRAAPRAIVAGSLATGGGHNHEGAKRRDQH